MDLSEINIYWRDYKFFPYEKKLALREIETLLSPAQIAVDNKKVTLKSFPSASKIESLVYFSHAAIDNRFIETRQNKAEHKNSGASKRQNTRYSVHGLHEYKGKFNPQVVRSLFNIYGISKSSRILDPFSGSGTTLVEASHIGAQGVGTDINPLAVFIANTKIRTLGLEWLEIKEEFEHLIDIYTTKRPDFTLESETDTRITYLKKWFPEDVLLDIECLRLSSLELKNITNLVLVATSNLLRDYSYQEPKDLRIRRRKSPLPVIPLIEELKTKMDSVVVAMKDFQDNFGLIESSNRALNTDINNCTPNQIPDDSIDFAITSPPYATALPYIDTQRLSLVWLSMVESKDIKGLETELIGSREFKVKNEQDKWNSILVENSKNLPEEVHVFCKDLFLKLGAKDGFRKKAVPALLYRYFFQMMNMFETVKGKLKPNSHFALIVGHNHTTIGGTRTDIDTPKLLVAIAESVGLELSENTPLEVYHRYGINSQNAVNKESLIVFRKRK
ncbi:MULTISPECIES: TRM11 family SAM-dependent methyltransferase [Flavobacteriaceae]|uniref:TRM11 family SAM-dependent methyltransferase n=1 Tax=Flavobacteriaceae TaxID=49546 RepID=UPI00234912D5|nr:DNA methyltransferase [Muricauda sp. SP22]MDC6361654.1 DNA methyltransferase [Muricauda sp. SP22]